MRSPAELDAALELRRKVFCVEQGVPLAADRDGRDHEAVQVVALDGERVVGTLRLLIENHTARLGRMVVDATQRGRGVAAQLLDAADQISAEEGATTIVLHAQLTARSVYDRAGYLARGAVFQEEDIDHVTMEKQLG